MNPCRSPEDGNFNLCTSLTSLCIHLVDTSQLLDVVKWCPLLTELALRTDQGAMLLLAVSAMQLACDFLPRLQVLRFLNMEEHPDDEHPDDAAVPLGERVNHVTPEILATPVIALQLNAPQSLTAIHFSKFPPNVGSGFSGNWPALTRWGRGKISSDVFVDGYKLVFAP